jgi:hypothetical protein
VEGSEKSNVGENVLEMAAERHSPKTFLFDTWWSSRKQALLSVGGVIGAEEVEAPGYDPSHPFVVSSGALPLLFLSLVAALRLEAFLINFLLK